MKMYVILILLNYYCNHFAMGMNFKTFKTMADRRIKTDFTYTEMDSLSILRCALFCARNERCQSASYGEDDGSCSLSAYRIDGAKNRVKIVAESSWTTLYKEDANVDKRTTFHVGHAETTTTKEMTTTEEGCGTGWREIGGTCYMFVEERKNYSEAMRNCEQRAGKLAEPQTSYKNTRLTNFLKVNIDYAYDQFWIGLTDDRVRFKFVWNSNGEAPDYSGWSEGYPTADSLKNCAMINPYHGHEWTDERCDENYNFEYRSICEK